MNNTFSFNRFKNLLLKDGKMYIRNYGTSLIVWCSLNAIFWIFNLLFGSETMPPIRFGMLCTWTALAMMMVPSKVYGNANLLREGVGFAMMPASSLEKFVSMFLYCAIVTPVIVFFGGYLVDTLLSLFPFGGFDKPIRLYTLNEIVSRMMTDNEGVVQMGELSISATTLLCDTHFPLYGHHPMGYPLHARQHAFQEAQGWQDIRLLPWHFLPVFNAFRPLSRFE